MKKIQKTKKLRLDSSFLLFLRVDSQIGPREVIKCASQRGLEQLPTCPSEVKKMRKLRAIR